ncbi:bacillithiol biosynthesis cysteine-adding enzyme BshC [Melghirimyces profundicolus]|uniref:Putative cysteine ligase BshC n=1 Tax=Melghirimyces profundicolus TaxID=1242148 RepID=A0A2T6B593_9BACL|nr:bacillithiol biosynthesis cysteine-adding enzyme BshC [Melghirimyces profundicolus]PTX51249.1 bacillithiol biosynthesis cysteine-adding enzyme BshC [Melghirimyces profundicolus]
MRVEDTYMEPPQPLFRDYLHFFHKVKPYYTYDPGDDSGFRRRAKVLERREDPVSRERLADVLSEYHGRELQHPAIQANLDRLRRPDSLVVVGGQQAGVLTGPLYTVYKAITLIQLAEREEQRLNRPVIPLFWIAGEDHDLEEVNHLHLVSGTEVEKVTLPLEITGNPSVSEVVPGPNVWLSWIDGLGRKLPDTPHKKGLLETLRNLSRDPISLSRHFARLLHRLFGHHGLLMIDSAYPPLRRLEVPFFEWLIEHNEAFAEAVMTQAEQLERDGYPVEVDVKPDKAHLFLISNGERRALHRRNDGTFFSREGMDGFSRESLLAYLRRHPAAFSNNVLTRPLMQEYLFPTLATVLGPGEIAYWALLKPAFHLAGMEMPLLVPRSGFTLVGRKSQKELSRYGLTVDDVIHRLERKKRSWLERRYQLDVDAAFGRLRTRLEEAYRPLIGEISGIRPDLNELGQTNLGEVFKQVDYLEKETRKAMEKRRETDLRRFAGLEAELNPGGQLQERVHNLVPWWNRYGENWLEELIRTPLLSKNLHRVVHL